VRKWLAVVAGVAILGAVNATISAREALVDSGRVVLLRLAPVDPRSMMQGDYMALRFEAADQATRGRQASQIGDGYLVVGVDGNKVGTFRRLVEGDTAVAGDEVKLRFRVRANQVRFATNAFFFQEGKAGEYAKARYGEFRVGGSGDMILTQMRDENFTVLGAQAGRPRAP
jgi:uncharacterized membrane-anchored protein